MTLEGMIRNVSGETATRRVEADTYDAALVKMTALVGDGSLLLWVREP